MLSHRTLNVLLVLAGACILAAVVCLALGLTLDIPVGLRPGSGGPVQGSWLGGIPLIVGGTLLLFKAKN